MDDARSKEVQEFSIRLGSRQESRLAQLAEVLHSGTCVSTLESAMDGDFVAVGWRRPFKETVSAVKS
jgi:hypothetical protein